MWPIKWEVVSNSFLRKTRLIISWVKERLNQQEKSKFLRENDAGKIISGSKIMIATGCKPRTLDEVAVDGVRVMTSREALAMKKQPESIAIMGAGAIGAEFAYFLNAFGTKVTLVEMLPNVLPVEDREVSDALLKSFKKQGIDCRTSTRVDNIEVKDESVVLSMAKGDDTEQLGSRILAFSNWSGAQS